MTHKRGDLILHPKLGSCHLKLDSDPLKSYHVPHIKALDRINPLREKDLSKFRRTVL